MYDPKTIRPRENWVLLLDDQRKTETASGIFLGVKETGVEKVREGSGVLVALGKGDKITTQNLAVGMRVAYRSYLKYANPIDTGEAWLDGENKRYFLMAADDIMCEVSAGAEVGVFSGRPQVKGK